jgi:hypothetical protein
MKKIIYLFGIVTLILSICSCKLERAPSIKILAGSPMDNSFITSYPEMKTLYESDNEFFLIYYWDKYSMEKSRRSKNHELKWELYNKNDVEIYNTIDKDVKIRPHTFHSNKIDFDKGIKDSLIPGMYTVKLYLDGDLVKTKSGEYVPKSIINKNVNSALILPFNDISVETNIPYNARPYIINTFSSAFYHEVKRIIPWTTPHYISETTVGGLSGKNCFKDRSCLKQIEILFENDIFISGNIRLSQYVVDIATLSVYVYNSKTGIVKRFSYSQHPRTGLKYTDLMHDLIKGVMHKKGFLDYLISL